jgi:hypothetical protein
MKWPSDKKVVFLQILAFVYMVDKPMHVEYLAKKNGSPEPVQDYLLKSPGHL